MTVLLSPSLTLFYTLSRSLSLSLSFFQGLCEYSCMFGLHFVDCVIASMGKDLKKILKHGTHLGEVGSKTIFLDDKAKLSISHLCCIVQWLHLASFIINHISWLQLIYTNTIYIYYHLRTK